MLCKLQTVSNFDLFCNFVSGMCFGGSKLMGALKKSINKPQGLKLGGKVAAYTPEIMVMRRDWLKWRVSVHPGESTVLS